MKILYYTMSIREYNRKVREYNLWDKLQTEATIINSYCLRNQNNITECQNYSLQRLQQYRGTLKSQGITNPSETKQMIIFNNFLNSLKSQDNLSFALNHFLISTANKKTAHRKSFY